MSDDQTNPTPNEQRGDAARDHALDFFALRVSPDALERVARGDGASARAVREYLGK